MADTSERPLRFCDICGGLDDHPRHVKSRVKAGDGAPTPEFLRSLPDGAPAEAIAQLMDPTRTIRHHDCCAANGCSECTGTEAANDGRRGQKLIDHLAAARQEG